MTDQLGREISQGSRRQEFSTRLDRRQCVAEARKRPRFFNKRRSASQSSAVSLGTEA